MDHRTQGDRTGRLHIWYYTCWLGALLLLASCSSRPAPPPATVPSPLPDVIPVPEGTPQYGLASWYGKERHGRRTASGEIYDSEQLTAAHRTAPFGTYALVTNLANGRTVQVRINDRGPSIPGRVIDLSYGAARQLDMVRAGVARVRVEWLAGAGYTSSQAETPSETDAPQG